MQAAETSRKKEKKTISRKGEGKLALEFVRLGDWMAAMELVTAIRNFIVLLWFLPRPTSTAQGSDCLELS